MHPQLPSRETAPTKKEVAFSYTQLFECGLDSEMVLVRKHVFKVAVRSRQGGYHITAVPEGWSGRHSGVGAEVQSAGGRDGGLVLGLLGYHHFSNKDGSFCVRNCTVENHS